MRMDRHRSELRGEGQADEPCYTSSEPVGTTKQDMLTGPAFLYREDVSYHERAVYDSGPACRSGPTGIGR
jgi:hypothetical protein